MITGMDDRTRQREQAITGAIAAQKRLLEDIVHLTDAQARCGTRYCPTGRSVTS